LPLGIHDDVEEDDDDDDDDDDDSLPKGRFNWLKPTRNEMSEVVSR